MSQSKSMRKSDLVGLRIMARGISGLCKHHVVVEHDVLISSFDGHQRMCPVCRITETSDFGITCSFNKLKNPKITLNGPIFTAVYCNEIMTLDEFIAEVKSDFENGIINNWKGKNPVPIVKKVLKYYMSER